MVLPSEPKTEEDFPLEGVLRPPIAEPMSAPRSVRVAYYLTHLASMLKPDALRRRSLPDLLKEGEQSQTVRDRAAYYLSRTEPFTVPEDIAPFRLRPWSGRSTYQLDLWESLRYFDRSVRVETLFGDNILNPERPSLVKSRPISSEPSNAVLLKLNRVRHFRFVEDSLPFDAKVDRLVWRGNACQPHRVAFLQQFHNHPRCDVGHYYAKPVPDMPYGKPSLTLEEQLQSKFVFALEGNDVATNLKWILSSNSLCVMPPCRYETWFMEGRLKAGVHYVEVAPDYSDLEEKLDYYSSHQEEAEAILKNASDWVAQFRDAHQERLIALRVLDQYLRLSGQAGTTPSLEGS